MKNRRIYYVPGVISLILLPAFGYFYLKGFIKNERVIEIVLPIKYVPNINYEHIPRFDTTVLSLPENKRKYLNFQLNGNLLHDKITLDSFEIKMRTIMSRKDTINGLHLLFGDKVKYGMFVESINICSKDSFSQTLIYENNLWHFYKKMEDGRKERIRIRRKERIEEDRARMLTKEGEINNLSVFEKYKELIKIWPSLIILVLLGILSLRSKNV